MTEQVTTSEELQIAHYDNAMTEQVFTSEELQLINPLAHLLPDSDVDDSDDEVIYEEVSTIQRLNLKFHYNLLTNKSI
jgi:hypothetical protein